jgi:hypothetical protein
MTFWHECCDEVLYAILLHPAPFSDVADATLHPVASAIAAVSSLPAHAAELSALSTSSASSAARSWRTLLGMVISDVRLLEKRGGKSGSWTSV